MYPYPLIGNYVTLYGICIAIGVLLCILLLRYYGKKKKLDQKFLDEIEITGYIAIALGFGFAFLFQKLYDFVKYGTVNWGEGGLTFLGGLIGGVTTFLVIYNIRRKKLAGRLVDILPIAPACITLAHGFGRIGCFFAGCCGGIKVNEADFFSFLGVTFPGHHYKTYPTQLFEACFLLILCLILIFLALKKNFKYNFVVYVGSYGVWRFFIEFIRGDDRGRIFKNVDWLSPSQFWSLIMVVGAIPLFFLLKKLNELRKIELAETNVITKEIKN